MMAAFRSAEPVVTDRFHGAIFPVLCRRPCVILGAGDHKLTAGASWFEGLRFVAVASRPEDVPALAERCLAAEDRTTPDWRAECFAVLPGKLDLVL